MNNIWIALAHVVPRYGFEKILDGSIGAYLNIIVKANNIKELKSLVNKEFYKEGLKLKDELQYVELISDRLKKYEIDEDILKLINNLSEEYPVQFGVFDTYEIDINNDE